MPKFTIPVDADPKEVAEAVGQYVVSHSKLTGRWYSSIAEEVKRGIGPKIMEAVLKDQEPHS